MDNVPIELPYGRNGLFQTEIPRSLLVAYHVGPQSADDVAARVAEVLASPMDFPALSQAVLAGDRVVLALDRETPAAATLIRGVWDVLEARGVSPHDVLILQPASALEASHPDHPPKDPRACLLDGVREHVGWIRHDPRAADDQFAYLATTTSGDRMYLAREIVEADFVVTIGPICFDSVLGHRGTSSVLYPGLARQDALLRARGLGHDELGPRDDRGLRQTIDEVGWLLGVQFTLQVIPGVGGTAAAVIAGASDGVFRQGCRLLEEWWQFHIDERVDFVIVAVEADEAGHDWSQVGAALETARRIVEKGGRILVLSQLDCPRTPGFELLSECRSPREALQPLRQLAPADLVAATQFAKAADWADVYLLSQLTDDVVEDLFCMALDSVDEAYRLVATADTLAVIGSAQHTYASIGG